MLKKIYLQASAQAHNHIGAISGVCCFLPVMRCMQCPLFTEVHNCVLQLTLTLVAEASGSVLAKACPFCYVKETHIFLDRLAFSTLLKSTSTNICCFIMFVRGILFVHVY